MQRRTFDTLREVVYRKSGIVLGPHKEALVSARLSRRMRELDCADHEAYLERLLQDAGGNELIHLLDAISTNVTSFFREPAHFEFIGRVVSDWLREGCRRLRVWSAASSTGEEPYTLAMTLLELEGAAQADIRILATDISTRVLERAREGVFDEARLKPVPPALRRRWLEPAGPGLWRVAEPLRRMVVFRRLNLAEPPYPLRGPLDLILCRNVMIYFDSRVRAGLLDQFKRLLRPGGCLLVGHAESLAGQSGNWQALQPSIYRKPGTPAPDGARTAAHAE